MNLTQALIDFVNDGQISSDTLEESRIEIGEERLRVIAITLLEWMKSQHRLGRLRPLRLRNDHTWCKELTHLMQEKGLFTDLLRMNDGIIDFAYGVAKEEQSELCKLADSGFSPRLMT